MTVFTESTPAAVLSGKSQRATQQIGLLFNAYSAGQEFVHFYGNRRFIGAHSGQYDGDGDGDDDNSNKLSTLECVKLR